jgi:hypothetical protein
VYDADNRIIEVFTTTTTPQIVPEFGQAASQNEPGMTPFWDREATYEYYAHGPLSRTELGEQKVQGTDNVYTIQGWLKSVNSNILHTSADPGTHITTSNTAKDAFGFSLHYYATDYHSISGIMDFAAAQTGSDLTLNSYDLYNGNIGRMVTTITDPTTRDILPLGNAYKYDQLNRLKQSKSFTTIDLNANQWNAGSSPAAYDGMYENYFQYDANGNILGQLRKDQSGALLDDLTYRYKLDINGKRIQNRLYHVNDVVSAGTFPDDIDDMGAYGVAMDQNTGPREIVYDESGEWTSASFLPGGAVNTTSTVDPKVGVRCVTFDGFPETGYVGFQRSTDVDVSSYTHFTFYIRNRTVLSSSNNLRLYISNSTTPIGAVDITNYGYNRGMVGQWQLISIPLSVFNITSQINRVRIRLSGSPTASTYNYDLDQLMFSTHAAPSISPNMNYVYDAEGRLIKDK